MHDVKGVLKAGRGCVKRVGIFHDEFSGSQNTKSWPRFVPEFGLNLVVINRQLLMTAQLSAGNVGNDLFVGRAEAKIAIMPVFKFEQQALVIKLPTSGFFPKLTGLRDRHQQFLSARSIHFFPHNVFYFSKHPKTEWHPRIDARGQFSDKAAFYQKLVGNNFCVRGHFFERRERKLRGFHGLRIPCWLETDAHLFV